MTPVDFKNLIRIQKTRTTTETFEDSDILLFGNTAIEEIAGRIQQLRPDIWNIPAYFSLIAGNREYGLPEDMLNKIRRVEIKLDPTGKYDLANGLKQQPRDLVLENEDDITSLYSGDPHYFIRRKALYLLSESIVDVPNGVLLTYNSFPAKLTSLDGTDDMSIDPSTTEHGFPREFHELAARRVSIMYKNREEVPLNDEEQRYDVDLEKALENFSAPADQEMEEVREQPSVGSLYGNGYDL